MIDLIRDYEVHFLIDNKSYRLVVRGTRLASTDMGGVHVYNQGELVAAFSPVFTLCAAERSSLVDEVANGNP